MLIRGTRGAPPQIQDGMIGSQAQLQSLDSGMHRHSPGPVPIPGTGPTDSGGGQNRSEGGQDPKPSPGGTPDGSSELDSSDGPVNSGPRARDTNGVTNDMVASASNNNSAPDNIDLIKFLGGPDEC